MLSLCSSCREVEPKNSAIRKQLAECFLIKNMKMFTKCGDNTSFGSYLSVPYDIRGRHHLYRSAVFMTSSMREEVLQLWSLPNQEAVGAEL